MCSVGDSTEEGVAASCATGMHSGQAEGNPLTVEEAAAQHLTTLGRDGVYIAFGRKTYINEILLRISQKGRLKLLGSRCDGEVGFVDDRVELCRESLEDVCTAGKENVFGVLLDLGAFEWSTCIDHDSASTDISVSLPQSATEWLKNVTATHLSAALDSFASLHDPLLADRLAAALLRGGPYTCAVDIEKVVEGLAREGFVHDEGETLQPRRLLRAMRVAMDNEVERLDKALEGAFQQLKLGGRCVVATLNPWELAAVRRFLRAHESPPAVVAASVCAERLSELYPFVLSGKDYVVRRAIPIATPLPSTPPSRNNPSDTAEYTGGRPQTLDCTALPRNCMLHVLEKVPIIDSQLLQLQIDSRHCNQHAREDAVDDNQLLKRSRVPPPQPDFAGAEGAAIVSGAAAELQKETISVCEGRAGVETMANLIDQQEVARLRQEIAARKAELREQGYGACRLKKDFGLSELIRQLNAQHCTGPRYTEKVQERCKKRVHVPVLLQEAVEHTLALGPCGLYVDGTFGRGGHSRAILDGLLPAGRLKAFDVDPLAVEVGRALQATDSRFEMFHRPFGDLAAALPTSKPSYAGVDETADVAGVLLDLGVSSPQLDDASRGFSSKKRCQRGAPLDLRMNPAVGASASEWLQTVNVAQLAWVIGATCYRLEAPLPERLAEVILRRQRERGPYRSTSELAAVLDEFNVDLVDEHPNLRLSHIVFVAIRVFLNREMEQLEKALRGAFSRLRPGGRCVVICFNRWEVAVVRRFLHHHEEPSAKAVALFGHEDRQDLARLYPLTVADGPAGLGCKFALRRVSRRIAPTAAELARNPRAMSVMHVLEKVPRHQHGTTAPSSS